jgi:glycosyltransferase involved in cell wall biosynthesis
MAYVRHYQVWWKMGKKKALQKKRNRKTVKNRPNVSLCMIVKDEEKFLPGCLSSVQGCVDEIIIVDTGSTDNTMGIAGQFGAKVFEHPWENDFAKHRNQSIAYASGDWILILDADEELVRPGGQILKKAVRNDGIDSIAVTVINPVNNGKSFATFNSVRAFRNNGHIRYDGIVHNREIGCNKTRFYPIQIIHHGYNLDEGKARAKFERTSTLLKKQIRKEPDNPQHHHYLSTSYMSLGSYDSGYYEKAIKESTLAIELASEEARDDPLILGSHYVAAASNFNLGNMEKAASICENALKRFPDHLDSLFLLARIREKLDNYQQAFELAERYLRVRETILRHPDQSGRIMHINISSTLPINMIRGKTALELGHKDFSEKVFRALCQEYRGDWNVPASIGKFYYEKSEYREAEYYLQRACNLKAEKLVLYMLCECQGKAKRTKDQIETLSRIIAQFPEEKDNLRNIGIAQFKMSNFRLAQFCLNKVSEMGDVTPEVTVYLGRIHSELAVASLLKSLPERPQIEPHS